MEDKDIDDRNIREMFESFDPKRSPDYLFLSRLEDAMDSVEMIRQKQAIHRRSQRRAMAAATAIGIVSGIILSYILPWTGIYLFSQHSSIVHSIACQECSINPVWYWIVIGLMSALMTFSAYDITLAIQKNKC